MPQIGDPIFFFLPFIFILLIVSISILWVSSILKSAYFFQRYYMPIFATNVLRMERRAILKNMMLLGVGASLPLKTLLARQNATVTSVGRPFHQFKLGELD